MLCRPTNQGPSNDDLLDELPPLDDDQEEGTPIDDLSDLGSMTLDEDPDRDDQQASDLDIGNLIDETINEISKNDDDDNGPSALDLDFSLSDTREEADDAVGVTNDDLSVGLDEIPEANAQDQDEAGAGGSGDDIDEGSLPELDTDNESDLPGELRIDIGLEFSEVRIPQWGQLLWQQQASPLIADPLDCLCVFGDRILGAGQGLVVLRWETQAQTEGLVVERQSSEFARVSGLCLEPDGEILIVEKGQLFESADSGQTIRELHAPESKNNRFSSIVSFGHRFGLAAITTSGPQSFVYKIANRSFAELNVEGQLRALTSSSEILWTVDQRNEGLYLGRTSDGEKIRSIRLEGANALLESEPMHLAVEGEEVVIANLAGHLFHSKNGGKTFAKTELPAELTAICLATLNGKRQILACLYVESEDKSYLLVGDPESGFEKLADLSPRVTTSAPDDSEGIGSVSSMYWDKSRSLLWIAGRFGLTLWQPGIPT